MERHKELLWLGLVVLAVGCVGLPASEEPASGEAPPTPSNWTSEEIADIPEEPRTHLTIGNESDLNRNITPHTYLLGNNHSESRTIQLTVWRDSTVVMNKSVTFQANSSVKITAYHTGSYTIVVDPEDGPRHVIDDSKKWDCNTVEMRVELRPDGEIDGNWFRTHAGC